MWQGDLTEAEQRHKMALAIFQSLKELKAEAVAWNQLGVLYQQAEAWQQAEQCYRESARIKETQGNLNGAASTWNNLAIVAEIQGKTDVAERWFRKAIAV
jgi:tetratricopeptide (TPR) repeat protein